MEATVLEKIEANNDFAHVLNVDQVEKSSSKVNPYLSHLDEEKGVEENLKFGKKRRKKLDFSKYEDSPSFLVEDGSQNDKDIQSGLKSAETAMISEDGPKNPFSGRQFSSNYFKLLAQRRLLPVSRQRQDFLDLVKENQIIVFVGETGSGKTTQIPQYLAHELRPHLESKMIACTQPRRVAAMSVAKRVAEEMDVNVGEQVGYSIRFEDCTSSNTIIKYMTDGMLLREAVADKTLSKYCAIILDEAHERTVQTDILMGIVKDLCRVRKDLKLVVMSATLEAEKFQTYFDNAPLLNVPGRAFPVELFYSQAPENNYLEAAIKTVIIIHSNEKPGDILLFLTGEEEIEEACRRLRADAKRLSPNENEPNGKLHVVPLYSSLPPAQQQRIFESPPPGVRKVVVSTNIAETSLTIDGVVYVVDPGFAKQKVYNPRLRVDSLQVTPISQAAARQRAGRAGRTKPGKCFRLYTEKSFNEELLAQTIPEMLRCSLGHTLLQLLRLEIPSIIHFDFMDPPAPETYMRALELLKFLGAINEEVQLTPTGRLMADFPLEPELSKMLIESSDFQCSEDILTIVSMLNVPWVFMRPTGQRKEADAMKAEFSHKYGDHFALLNVYNKYLENNRDAAWCQRNYLNSRTLRGAENVRQQLLRSMQRADLKVTSIDPHLKDKTVHYESIARCIFRGYFMQVAMYNPKTKRWLTTMDHRDVLIHPSSCVNSSPEWVLYQEYVMTSGDYIRTVMQIKGEWLPELAPEYYKLDTMANGPIREALEKMHRKRVVLNNASTSHSERSSNSGAEMGKFSPKNHGNKRKKYI